MKNLLFIFTVALSLNLYAAAQDYSNFDLKIETRKLCRLVDSLEPGSHHYMSCKWHAKNITEKRGDLIQDTYKICSKGMVSEPHRCYTMLSKNFFTPLLDLKRISFDDRMGVENFILEHLFESRANFIRRSSLTHEIRIYISLQETLDLVHGASQNIMDAIVMSCSRMSDWNMLMNPNETDEWFDRQNSCFEAGFSWLEQRLLK